MGFSIVYQGVKKISRVFSIIPRTPWPQQGLQGHQITNCGSKDIPWGHCKSMLASMTISSTISPFVIDDNNSCSPYEHAPLFSASLLLSSSVPLWHQWQRVFTYLSLKSLITADWNLLPLSICMILGFVCMPGVTILSPLSSFSSLMNSRCAKVFERPYTWLAVW